jgi:PST family polysaccharide transporter
VKPFDANGAFRAAVDDGGLRRLAVRGAGVTVLAQALVFVVQVISTVVLARLLMPGDFGLVAMVTTFSLLLVSFGLNGFTEAVIQRPEMDHFLASNMFWINVSAGLLLTIAFAAAGSLLARLYGDLRVARVAVGISVTIFITSTSVQHLALLKRAMRLSAISINDIVARAVSVAVSILLARAGWEYWALVAGAVAQPLATSVGAWTLCSWVPGLPGRVAGTASVVRFAMNIYGRFTVNYFTRNTDNLLVGWRFGSGPLGFYKKAYDLFLLSASLLVSPLTAVAVPALSRLSRDSVQYRRLLLRTLAVIAFVGMGCGADLTLVGKDVIRLTLGPGWETAGRIFTFFGPGVGVVLLYGTHGWIHVSIGTVNRWFRWVVVEFTVTGLLFLLGLPWGPEGIAVAWTVSFWVLVIPAFWYAGRPIGLGIAPVVMAVWKYVLASLLAGCASAVILRDLPVLAAAPGAIAAGARVVIGSLLCGALYLAAVVMLHRGCAPLYQFAGLLREMILWGRFSRPASAVTAGTGADLTQTDTGKTWYASPSDT